MGGTAKDPFKLCMEPFEANAVVEILQVQLNRAASKKQIPVSYQETKFTDAQR